MISILYGCCYKAELNIFPNCKITYVDIIPNLRKSNGSYICCDIRSVSFEEFDIIVLSPPCNYYSRSNWRRDTSKYAQETKDLLPYCIKQCLLLDKPFIIENVRNSRLFKSLGLFDTFYYLHGRHTYFTNVMFDIYNVPQVNDNIKYIAPNKRQGGENVNNVFNKFIDTVLRGYYYD